jgi:hypothetical protein
MPKRKVDLWGIENKLINPRPIGATATYPGVSTPGSEQPLDKKARPAELRDGLFGKGWWIFIRSC